MSEAISLDDLTPDEIAHPSTFSVEDVAAKGAVFIIPVDAPLPSELGETGVPSGTLYARLAPLCSKDPEMFAFVPVSGAELLQLERPWRLLQVARRVFALFELPGARYDVMFTQAAKQIGLRRVDWPSVAEALASQATEQQRVKDSHPWDVQQDLSVPGRRLPKVARVSEELPEPPPSNDDAD